MWYLCDGSIGKPYWRYSRQGRRLQSRRNAPLHLRNHRRIGRRRPAAAAAFRPARRRAGRPTRPGHRRRPLPAGHGPSAGRPGVPTKPRLAPATRSKPCARKVGTVGHRRDRSWGGDAEGADPPLLLQRQALADIADQQVDMAAEQRLGRRDAAGEGDMDHRRRAGPILKGQHGDVVVAADAGAAIGQPARLRPRRRHQVRPGCATGRAPRTKKVFGSSTTLASQVNSAVR